MSKGGGTTTVQKVDPWSGVQPFLLGSQTTRLKQGVQPAYTQQHVWNQNAGDGGAWEMQNVIANPSSDYETINSPGIYPEVQRLYQQQGWSQGMTDLTNAQSQHVAGRAGQVGQAYGVGNAALSGGFDPNVQRVANIAGADKINAMTVNPTQAFGSMGGANPTQSIQSMLTGQANTSTLDPVVNNAMTRLSQNFNEQVMPGIRGSAVAAGQYGSSRQGIAEGLAARGLSQSMGDMASSMYNNAYNTAQGLMGTTANNMAGLSLNNSQANANRDLSAQTSNASNQLTTQQFNANLGLQNNQQAMQLAQQQIANRAQGLNLLGTGNALQDQNYAQQMGLLNAPNDYNWQNLNKYASIVSPGAGIGGTTTGSSDGGGSNPLASAVGGGLTGASLFGAGGALAGAMGLTGTTGGLLGAGLGLLMSDRRVKTDIEAVGKMDNGLTIYRYRYKFGGPAMLGVMADEVKAVNPAAVVSIGGIDHVNYGAL